MLIILVVLSLALVISSLSLRPISNACWRIPPSRMSVFADWFASGTAEGYSAAMFYTLTYAVMALGAFGMMILLSRTGFEAETLDDFKGLNERNPWFAGMMLLLMFSMAGVPPTVGFYAKLVVLRRHRCRTGWLAVVAVLFLHHWRFLLFARDQADVFRCARRHDAADLSHRPARHAERQCAGRAVTGHLPGWPDGLVRLGDRLKTLQR